MLKGTLPMSYERTDRRAQRRARTIRWVVLLLVLTLVTGLVTAHQRVTGSGRPVGVDALCPFGGIETIFTLITGAGFVEKTAASAIVLLVGSLVLTLLLRRSFCGQLCPLGTLQQIFGWIGSRFIRKRPLVPRAVDRLARYLKYAVLAVFTVWTWQAATLVMRPYDPWAAFAHLSSQDLLAEFSVGVTVLAVSLAGSLVYERFFCKYLCPTGALLGLLSKISLFGVRRDAYTCTSCSACDKACPMNLTVSEMGVVDSPECISCNECVNACPVQGALEVRASGANRIPSSLVTGAVAAVLVAAVGISTVAGAFAWRMPSLGEAVERQAEERRSAGQDESAGSPAFDTELIKGYMSMSEIAQASGLAPALFVERWGVPEGDLSKPMKDIKEQYDFSPDDVRVWVAEKLSE